MRVEIILAKTDNVPAKMMTALENEVKKQVSVIDAEALVRVRESTSKEIIISGCLNETKKQIMDLIENIFTSDDWIPEQQ